MIAGAQRARHVASALVAHIRKLDRFELAADVGGEGGPRAKVGLAALRACSGRIPADDVILGGLAAIHQFVRLGRGAMIGGMAGVVADVIPYGSVMGERAHLAGLNLVGLKRRGFSRETINDLRSAYRLLFADEGTFQERVEDVARVFAGAEQVMEIIDFIRADANRPLCQPRSDD